MQNFLEQKGKSVAPLQNSGGKTQTDNKPWLGLGKGKQCKAAGKLIVDTVAQQGALPGTGALTWDLPRSHL